MNQFLIRLTRSGAKLVAAPLLLVAALATAADAPRPASRQASPLTKVSAETVPAFEARLRAMYPTQKFDSVRPSALPGFYEITMGKSIAYVEENGRFFMFGALWDMAEKRDLSSERRAELDKTDPQQLPAQLGLAFGSGSRVLHVFADPNCGYCRQLESTLAGLSDVKVIVYPVPILGDASVDMVRRIWCSPNRATAWREWMTKGVKPAAASPSCEAPIEALLDLSSKSAVRGTPTMFAADGRRTAGAMDADAIAAFIGPAPKSSRATTPKTTAESGGASGARPVAALTAGR